MSFLLWFLLGVLGSFGQQLAGSLGSLAPDLLCVGTVLILTRTALPDVAAALIGFLVGFRAGTLEPLSCALLGGGLAAIALLSLRELLFTDRLPVYLVMTALAFACLHLARAAGVGLGAAPPDPPGSDAWKVLVATLVAAPVALAVRDLCRRLLPSRRLALTLSAEPRIPHRVVE